MIKTIRAGKVLIHINDAKAPGTIAANFEIQRAKSLAATIQMADEKNPDALISDIYRVINSFNSAIKALGRIG